jgi:hypothetical protein
MTRQVFASSKYIHVHTLPRPEKNCFYRATTHGFFRAFLGNTWPLYKKLLQIRSVSDQLTTNIREKMCKKSWFRLATQSLQGGGGHRTKSNMYVLSNNPNTPLY